MGGTKRIVFIRYFLGFFFNHQATGFDIAFIFARCHRSWAAETSGRYERDKKNPSHTFAKSKFPITEKLVNRSLVPPPLDLSDAYFVINDGGYIEGMIIYVTPHMKYVVCVYTDSWWRHQMEIFSALLAICAGNSPVPGEFPTQRPVTRSFDVYLDLCPNKGLSKQSWGWWFEMPSPIMTSS